MAIANLHETLMSYKLRRNALNLEITQLQNQKSLATYSQADAQSLKNAQDRANRSYFKQIYEADQADGGAHLYDDYKDHTEIPDFEEEVNKITASFQDQLDELTAWETQIDAQITADSAELEEVNAYLESLKSMLSSNIQEDFNYGLNG